MIGNLVTFVKVYSQEALNLTVCRPLHRDQSTHLEKISTALFNNKRTLKFKIQPTVTLFTAVSLCSGPLGKQKPFGKSLVGSRKSVCY